METTVESNGDDRNSQEESPKLRVGDLAPPLVIDEWMQSIPCSFVIDRKSKIAFIGPPRDSDYVMSRNQAARVADLMKLAKQPQEVLH